MFRTVLTKKERAEKRVLQNIFKISAYAKTSFTLLAASSKVIAE